MKAGNTRLGSNLGNDLGYVLGIETSCDETGVAIYHPEKGVVAEALYSQVALHAEYGGVVPELASRDHVRKLLPLIKKMLSDAGLLLTQIEGVAYTAGPGLLGGLLVGSCFGRMLAFSLGVPALAVHHMEGHLLSPMLVDNKEDRPSYPFVALLVSGGHTQLMAVRSPGVYEMLGQTVDDAAGEAFDKAAKAMGLPYPGGPHLAQLAERGRSGFFDFPRPMLKKPGCDFSFSGLKTAVQMEIRRQKEQGRYEGNKAHIAASFQQAVVDTLVVKSVRALNLAGVKNIVVAGGVSANVCLQEQLQAKVQQHGGRAFFPPPSLCSDNGAMIAYAGYLRLQAGQKSRLVVASVPRWELSALPPIV